MGGMGLGMGREDRVGRWGGKMTEMMSKYNAMFAQHYQCLPD